MFFHTSSASRCSRACCPCPMDGGYSDLFRQVMKRSVTAQSGNESNKDHFGLFRGIIY